MSVYPGSHQVSVKRAKTSARGYGADHQRRRRALEADVATGKERCTRCGRLIRPGERWHLDHTDDRSGYLGAAHEGCNSGAPHRRRSSRAW